MREGADRDVTPSDRPTIPDRTVELSIPATPADRQDPAYGRAPTVSFPHSHSHSQPVPRLTKSRVKSLLAPLIAVVVIVGATIAGAILIPDLTRRAAPPAPAKRTYSAAPSVLPFSDLEIVESLAADGAGNVYVLSGLLSEARPEGLYGPRHLLKLAPGASTPTEVDFPGVDVGRAIGVAADAAGNVYLCDGELVWVLAPGSSIPLALPFREFISIEAIAVDPAGTVYAVGGLPTGEHYGVKKLPLGAASSTNLPFIGLYQPKGLAADNVGNVYVGNNFSGTNMKGQVLRLAPGGTSATEMRLPDLKYDARPAVDAAGNLYVADSARRVLMLPVGAADAVTLDLRSGLVAVDAAGNVYGAASAKRNRDDQLVSPGQVFKLAPDT